MSNVFDQPAETLRTSLFQPHDSGGIESIRQPVKIIGTPRRLDDQHVVYHA